LQTLCFRYYCPPGQSLKEPPEYYCRIGHYCPGGTSDQKPCAINEMANYTHAQECDLCPAGFYCLKSGIPVECEKGYYCPAGTGKDLRPCPRGTIGSERQYNSVIDCKPCPAGKYCGYQNASTYTGLCDVGHWCEYGVDRPNPIGVNQTLNETASSLNNETCTDGRETGYGGICPAGHFCIAGSERPEPCDIGQYGPIEGLGECYPCMKGFYCPENKMTDYSMYVCPKGHYCPNNTKTANQFPCPIGTFSDKTGNTELSDCQECSPGRFCPVPGEISFFFSKNLRSFVEKFTAPNEVKPHEKRIRKISSV